MTNKTPMILLAALSLAVPLLMPASPVEAAAPVVVKVNEVATGSRPLYAYDPPVVTVSPGGTVTWINTGTMFHTVTVKISSSGETFDMGIEPGESASYTFAEPGVSVYHCIPHELPQNGNMRGGVIVA